MGKNGSPPIQPVSLWEMSDKQVFRNGGESGMGKPRVRIFDLIRVLAIAIIVCYHSWGAFRPNSPTLFLPVIGLIGMGTIGISLFVFVSGAVLELSYRSKPAGYLSFIRARVIRIYPAFWGALLLLMAVIPIPHTLPNILLEFTGMGGFFLKLNSMIDAAAWFISLILVYYLIFPFIHRWMETYSLQIVCLSVIITLMSYYLHNQFPANFSLALPIQLFQFIAAFVIGIYVVKTNWYREEQSPRYLSFLAEFSFYVYLIHAPIVYYYKANPVFAISLFIALSVLLMTADTRIQKYLKNTPEGRNSTK
jgi:peptidoglycan/LPS O-acetylase OafA/YrhL